ncbi:MAG: AsnC family transcriptional regulator, partial [Betaproteobacteria bacterium]
MKKLDAIDLKILAELQRDGRLSIVALAKIVGLSPTPCAERVRALEA